MLEEETKLVTFWCALVFLADIFVPVAVLAAASSANSSTSTSMSRIFEYCRGQRHGDNSRMVNRTKHKLKGKVMTLIL